jgi:gluconate 2-dehydrogenase gamma chain
MGGELVFFNPAEADAVEALAARVIPGDAEDPGAREADVLTYIDRSLGGAYLELRTAYRRGVAELERHCAELHGGRFAELPEESQDLIVAELGDRFAALEAGEAEPDGSRLHLLAVFFGIVRQHTLEGMFSDPMYGGNRDCVGWKLVGFPGAQWGYSAEQMRPDFDTTRIPVKTLSQLREEWTDRHRERIGDDGSR